MSDPSDPSGSQEMLRNGPESSHVVAAVEAALRGDADGATRALADGAATTSWSAVLHRLDVAGRALAADDDPGRQPGSAAAPLCELLDADPDGAEGVRAAWRSGGGVDVAVDLESGRVDLRDEAERARIGLAALADLVERSGFPAEVVC